MSEHSLKSLASRIEKVEQQNRRLKIIGAVALFLVGSILIAFMLLFGGILKGWHFFLPTIHAKHVHANRYIVIDKDGDYCGSMSKDYLRVGGLQCYSSQNETSMSLYISKKVIDSPSISMSVKKNEDTSLILNTKSHGHIFLFTDPKVKTPLIMIGKKKKVLWSAP